MKNSTSKKLTNEAENFRDFITRFESFGKSIAFKYKENNEIKEITYEQYVKDIEWEQDGGVLVILLEDYVWCDHHEQERSDIIPLRYRKNEEGVFVRL